MAKIIQEGSKHKTVICEDCGCIFSYLPYEIYKKGSYNYIQCPDCLYSNIIKEDIKKINKEA